MQDVAVNDGTVFWPELSISDDPAAIGRAPIVEGTAEPLWQLTSGGGELGNFSVEASESHVFWKSSDTNGGGGGGYIGRMRLDGTGHQPRWIMRSILHSSFAIAP